MKSAYRMQCWIGNIGEKLHDSVFNLSFVIVSSGMHLQSSLMMMMMMMIISGLIYQCNIECNIECNRFAEVTLFCTLH